jgi:hypothetical protein
MLYEYWVEGKRTVHPRHTTLQDAFVLHLKSQRITCEQNTPDYIDLMYKDKKNLIITEVKSAESVGTKYAIRAAIGQLLEYRHTIKHPSALLHIVLDKKPRKNEIEFVKSLDIILSYTVIIESFMAASVARLANGGYEVIVDGIVGPWFIEPWLKLVQNGFDVRYIILRPDEQTAISRAKERDKSALTDVDVIEHMWRCFSDLGKYESYTIDTTNQTIEATVTAIHKLLDENLMQIV